MDFPCCKILSILSEPSCVNTTKWHRDSDRNVTTLLRGQLMDQMTVAPKSGTLNSKTDVEDFFNLME